uniref:Uncharacterized protein n=1 Tax=Ciona savignyi TaxID=51511 RepID=H2YVN1_CIOSA
MGECDAWSGFPIPGPSILKENSTTGISFLIVKLGLASGNSLFQQIEMGRAQLNIVVNLKSLLKQRTTKTIERISPWAKYVVQCDHNQGFKWKFWNPPSSQRFQITHTRPRKPDRLRIYEAHIGIASERCEISTYRYFTSNILPRIRDQGYNSLLLMAVVEHSYYPSWG